MTSLHKQVLFLSVLMTLSSLSACSYPTGRQTQFLNPTEQLLVSKAIKRSTQLAQPEISPGTSVFLDVSGLTKNQEFFGDILAGWLGKQEIVVRRKREDATIRIQVIIQSLGTRRGTKFLGLPKSQSTFSP